MTLCWPSKPISTPRHGTFRMMPHLFYASSVKSGVGGVSQEGERRCRHNGPSIRFPFWVKGFHLDRYRYPGFELSCDKNKQTILDLPFSVKLFVKKIDYKSQVIRLYDPDGCVPAKLPNLNLSASPFQFNEIYLGNYSLFNCSAPGRQIHDSVPCLRASAYQVYAIWSMETVDDYPLTSCIKIHDLQSVPYNIFDQRGKLQLSWSKPNCSFCEAEGKICRLKDNTTEHETECVATSKTLQVFLPPNLEAAQEGERCRHNGPSIRFPFWVKAFHPDRYRYPGQTN
ncbi:unnamed protein product [Ilex paraguariensis]|uniref:RING-type E3 ubiquitin transferase n=1 Tax=Ilex paraguariensis TaxID=185542 RepID=A0ABC8TPF7_9AQUA